MNSENGQKEKKPFKIKEFFKSTSFKCIAVLLAIVLVCGILLTICNSLFEVTDQERLDRVLSQIYGESVETKEHALTEYETTEFDNGNINNVYEVVSDGNYLINATGTGGFSGGTVTCWVVIEMTDGAVSGIGNVVVSENTNQSWIANVPDSAFEHFGDSYTDGETFDVSDWKDNGLTGGATGSTTAIVNAVNTALLFARSQIAGEVIEPEINPFEDFEYTEYIDTAATEVKLADNGTDVIFDITTANVTFTEPSSVEVTVGADGKITAYKVTDENSTQGFGANVPESILNGTVFEGKGETEILELLGDTEDGSFVPGNIDETLHTHATYSNFYFTYAALFAAANYENGYVMALENSIEYTEYIDMESTKAAVSGTDVIFNITTANVTFTEPSSVEVTVGADGKITAYKVTDENSTQGFGANVPESILNGTVFEGKGETEILELLGDTEDSSFVPGNIDETLHTHATYSNFYFTYAALFAASNYEVYAKLAAIEQEQLNAQMSEIYGETIAVEAVSLDGLTTTVGNGTVNTVYKVTGTDNYIINATGTGGFSSGTVTCWVVVETENGTVSAIKNVEIESNVDQSYIDRITETHMGYFDDIAANNDFTVTDWQNDTIHGGATVKLTMTAIVNSVNSAKNFVANLITAGGADA